MVEDDIVLAPSLFPLRDLWSVVNIASGDIKEKKQALKKRAAVLNSLEIREIHITGGENNLRLTLSKHARWTDATTETRYGQVFCPNFPSHEIFTVPDCRETKGKIIATQQFRLFDFSMVRNLALEFHDGRVSHYHASTSDDDFCRWISIDAGASMLGEIGLVGNDAPLYGFDHFFDAPLFDENTSSHIGLGQGVSSALVDSDQLSDVFLDSIGCNSSTIHTDICFGSPEVSIVATKSARGAVTLLDGGAWGV